MPTQGRDGEAALKARAMARGASSPCRSGAATELNSRVCVVPLRSPQEGFYPRSLRGYGPLGTQRNGYDAR
jgi:hypothetical protein